MIDVVKYNSDAHIYRGISPSDMEMMMTGRVCGTACLLHTHGKSSIEGGGGLWPGWRQWLDQSVVDVQWCVPVLIPRDSSRGHTLTTTRQDVCAAVLMYIK